MSDDTLDELHRAPPWARQLDAAGHRTWAKRRRQRPGELIAGVVVNVAVIIVAHQHDLWRPWTHGVVTPAFAHVLVPITVACATTIACNALMLVFPFRVVRHAAALAMSVANLVSTAAFYDVFPLDFSRIGLAWVGSLVHVLLLVVIVGISIAVVVHAVRLLFGRRD